MLLAVPALANAPLELFPKATSTRLTKMLALAAAPALTPAPPAPSSKANRQKSYIHKRMRRPAVHPLYLIGE